MKKKKKNNGTHEGPKVIKKERKKWDTWRSQNIDKNDEHMKAHKKIMLDMSQNKKLEEEIILNRGL